MTVEDSNQDGMRLAKRLAEELPCSRAEAERYIAGGWVSVDGAVVEDPAVRVTDDQDVLLLPGAEAVEPAPVTILLHKPAGVDLAGALALIGPATMAQARPQDRFLRRYLNKLEPMMALETAASGLAVFTQDWRIARRLTDDASRVEQEYVVEVTTHIGDAALAQLNGPLRLGSRMIAPIKASRQSEARLRLAGKDVRPGQAAAMCVAAGLEVKAQRRLRIGRVSLGALPLGHWRFLHEAEKF